MLEIASYEPLQLAAYIDIYVTLLSSDCLFAGETSENILVRSHVCDAPKLHLHVHKFDRSKEV